MFGAHVVGVTLFGFRSLPYVRWISLCNAAANWDNQGAGSDSWSDEAEVASDWDDRAKNYLQIDKC